MQHETISDKTLGSAQHAQGKEVCRTIPAPDVANHVRYALFNDAMKTIQQITDEINWLMETGSKSRNDKEKNSIRKKLQFLRPVAMYMETDPTEESVSRQLNECIGKMLVIQKEFDHTYPSYCDTRTKSEFMKGKGLPELKKQVKVLQYLLESK